MNLPNDRDVFKARWVRVSTEMLEHEILDKGPFDRRSAWLWLIAAAAWRQRRINHKGKPLTLERGQVLAGRAFLAETWGWGEQQVRTFLNLLAAEGMIKTNQSGGHFANVVTICNYEKYQSTEQSGGQSDNQSATSVQPVSNQTLTKDTNTTIGKGCARERSSFDWGAATWGAENVASERKVLIGDDGIPVLLNGFRANWLERFGGDEERLDLALEQAAGWLQPNNPSKPLEAQVSSQLARILGEKKDRDARAERASARPSVSAKSSATATEIALAEMRARGAAKEAVQ